MSDASKMNKFADSSCLVILAIQRIIFVIKDFFFPSTSCSSTSDIKLITLCFRISCEFYKAHGGFMKKS